MYELLGIVGFIISVLPIAILPLKIKTGIRRYLLLFIFLVIYYLFLAFYGFSNNNIFITFMYLSEVLFFLNIYRAYLHKELLFTIPFFYYINDLSIIFSFYLITFNVIEIFKEVIKGKKTSIIVLFSLTSFEVAVILQILYIFQYHKYLDTFTQIIFLLGSVLFVIPALRVAYEKEEI